MDDREISTRHPANLPPPDRLLKLCQSLALLDAILSPEWEYRSYSFNAHWDVEKRLQMGSMRNGSGDEFFILFSPQGAVILGCMHESAMADAFNETGAPP